jgi:hypothetical protein
MAYSRKLRLKRKPKSAAATSEAARVMSLARKTHTAGPGRRKVLRPCPKCGVQCGARELRRHKCR